MAQQKHKNNFGALIESGAQNWQIIQQDKNGLASLTISGSTALRDDMKTLHGQKRRVYLRLVDEDTGSAVNESLQWQPASMKRGGKWSHTLKNIPVGGLYRLETVLYVGPKGQNQELRGDIIHHLGVGDVWLLMGQSNCEGHGKVPVEDMPQPGIHLFRTCGRWDMASHPLNDNTGTIYPENCLTFTPTHSPWLAFARRLKEKLGYPIGLIPASLGGSPLSAWNRKEDGCLFENMLPMITDAGGKVRGVIWYQGESDAATPTRRTYTRRFKNMVGDLRRTLKNPQLPIITMQINRVISATAEAEQHQDWEEMREVQRRMPEKLKNCFVVSTLDCGLSDSIHNNSPSNVIIGERAARTALGGVYGMDISCKCPDCKAAKAVSSKQIELVFANVSGRLHYENNMIAHLPFAVRDEKGGVPIIAWTFRNRDRLRLKLGRKLSGKARVIGAPTAAPGMSIPEDVPDYRPMLGFIQAVE